MTQAAMQAHAHDAGCQSPPQDEHRTGHEAEHHDYFGAKLGMWLFLVTEILLFSGLFIAYSYMRSRYPAEFHHAGSELNAVIGVANTFILLTSSLTMALGIVSLQRGNRGRSLLCVAATIVLGLAFLVDKAFEWTHEIGHGLYPRSPVLATHPPGEQVFFGLYYTMTGLHGLHVVAGMALLTIMAVLLVRGRITPERPLLLENSGLYWHLVDVVWIFLLPLFYLAA
ncbi:MAG: cytochrome c oxidase subunit 3 family protein [Holophaga sp.]|jgi:cytochrome c oxidase subunit 3